MFFNTHIAEETSGIDIYTMAPIIEDMGHYPATLVNIVAKEEEELESRKNTAS
ncbi:MAG: hypothetical protein QXV82_06420 [Ignisphaera sp.]